MIKKSIKDKIKDYFLNNPTKKLRVRQIERQVKVPLPSAIRYAKELEKQGILKTTLVSNIKLYSADRSSDKFFLRKKQHNIRQLYDSGLINYLKTEYSNPLVIVFGSYSKGEDIETSDIDLYIEPKKSHIDLEKFEKKLNKKIQVFNYNSIKNIKNNHLANNIINGTILNGFLEVFK